jgi:hypothetical protein
MHRRTTLTGWVLGSLITLAVSMSFGADPEVTDIGDRLELFVDKHRIESMKNVRLVLHHPSRMEVALKLDDPWDGRYSGYFTVFQDGDLCRMYYRGWAELKGGEQVTCYAESKDGIHWSKPNIGLFEFNGSKENNIIWKGPQERGTHNFTPFKDTRPGIPADQQYKALGGRPLYAFASGDGIQWRYLVEKPVITKGAFDSQNVAFWDANRRNYVTYYRIFREGVRAVATATSDDFVHWTDPTPIDLGDTPPEHFYTNATLPYFRAPHYYLSFPKRFIPDRKRLPDHSEKGISEGIFMSSRDGLHFDRTFMEAFIRPGRDRLNWGDRSNMPVWGILHTAPDEMSIYFSQHYGFASNHIRRGVLRLDGIASASAGYEGGELVTTPIRFSGKRLLLNYATAASGSIRIEIQDLEGVPITNFSLADAKELYGDEIAEVYSWESGSDVSSLAGEPVRVRFVMKDADLYSYRFAE